MWSTAFTGRMSALNAQQRILFPLRNYSETAKRQLSKALLFGICTGVAILAPDDANVLRMVHATLQIVYAKNALLSRTQFAIVMETGVQWKAEQLHDRVKHTLQCLQLPSIDLLLLNAQSLSIPESSSTSERKRITLHYWQQMIAIQSAGLVSHIGVSDFTFQQVEFILTMFAEHPPTAFALAASVIPSSSSEKEPNCTRLATSSSFAHGKGMDVILRFPFRALETMPLAARDNWKRLARAIAQKHRAQSFQVAITHEADKEPFQTQQHSMGDTLVLQSPLQIVMRYLMQRGVVVIPMASDFESESSNEENLDDEECHELFYALLHPFTALTPSYSANQLYSSVLSEEDLVAIDHTLRLGCHPAS
uniref:Uncharacterized protein n=1 Tax=Globisporangium ultimum (strain ATCC 200006 / CBS 805.95 / DAOM BR144) TaxID=431595 RepID=K3WUH4_GLOUD